jgi:hypothetical protein
VYIPEWEIEELLTRNPRLLGFPSDELRLIERQKYLEKPGKYIDLLYKMGDAYLIVEIKSARVNDKSVVTHQLLPYKKALASEFNLPEDKIVCVLISPNGFTEQVKNLCQDKRIITRTLDQSNLVTAIKKLSLRPKYAQREPFSNINSESPVSRTDIQDEGAKRELASLFVRISENAPIQAHEVGTESNGTLITNHDMWFWLFYSVMDRRANAATFVKAKQALEKERLFAPYKIVELLKEKGERTTLNKIAKILEDADFPLLNDHVMGKLAFPKSIVDAAKFMSNYGYDFIRLYEEYVKAHQENLIEARNSLWKDFQKKIYGVGPRIASQIIRGLVLKGPWKYPLNDNQFLEKCRFNIWIAGETRLGLIGSESEHYEQLGRFADDFLDGNRGIIAHVLWYIRKRYCKRPPKCDQCMVSGYCLHPCSSYSLL